VDSVDGPVELEIKLDAKELLVVDVPFGIKIMNKIILCL
jgi:hypothetical protein